MWTGIITPATTAPIKAARSTPCDALVPRCALRKSRSWSPRLGAFFSIRLVMIVLPSVKSWSSGNRSRVLRFCSSAGRVTFHRLGIFSRSITSISHLLGKTVSVGCGLPPIIHGRNLTENQCTSVCPSGTSPEPVWFRPPFFNDIRLYRRLDRAGLYAANTSDDYGSQRS
jgi:hypothetical protein